ncbi:uncharacterized protein LOC109138835 [Tachysurus ichikawai]
MLKLHTKMEDKLLDLESRSGCDNIRIYGVPEGAEKDSTTMVSGGIRGPAEKRLHCDNHQTSGDARGAGAAVMVMVKSGQTSEEGHTQSMAGSMLQGEAPNLQKTITGPLQDLKDLTQNSRTTESIVKSLELYCKGLSLRNEEGDFSLRATLGDSKGEGEAHQVSEWDEEGNHIDAKQVFKDSIV